ncbi:MAG: glutathione S-transferase family protein [Dongiaceae bacterium]
MLKLFYAPGSCALASHIALEESGAPYEAERVDLGGGQQRSPAYLKLNPKGRVPALATDRGVISENPAILAYVAQSFPQAKLAPLDDPFAFARIQAFNGYLSATLHVAHAHGRRGTRWVDETETGAIEAMKRKVPQSVGDCFDLVEREMFAGPWAMGADYTIADPYLFTVAGWIEGDGLDPKRFPKILDHRNRMAERPAVRKVMEREGR